MLARLSGQPARLLCICYRHIPTLRAQTSGDETSSNTSVFTRQIIEMAIVSESGCRQSGFKLLHFLIQIKCSLPFVLSDSLALCLASTECFFFFTCTLMSPAIMRCVSSQSWHDGTVLSLKAPPPRVPLPSPRCVVVVFFSGTLSVSWQLCSPSPPTSRLCASCDWLGAALHPHIGRCEGTSKQGCYRHEASSAAGPF